MAEYFDAHEAIASESLLENEASDESGLSDVTTSNSEPEEGHGTSLITALINQDLMREEAMSQMGLIFTC